jgi:hypothetical protein
MVSLGMRIGMTLLAITLITAGLVWWWASRA